ncbi:MAG: hypothetical protein NTW59_03405 [Candidatus Diapherotrites archaeon]|nr:hypothetical protein [Candidatus Diapherotrites archaeon]
MLGGDFCRRAFGMNESGMVQIFVIILAVLALIIVLPALVMITIPAADIIMRIILIFLIFTTVRGYIGNGILSILISGVLIYYLVIKHPFASAIIYVAIFFLLTLQVFSVVIFGIGMGLRKF